MPRWSFLASSRLDAPRSSPDNAAMQLGEVLSIHVASASAAATVQVDDVRAEAERGLVGDRKYIDSPKADNPSRRQITLIEAENIEQFNDAVDEPVTPGELRRQVVTQGVRLNDLVDQEFYVGEVRVRGTMLCEPCEYLAQLISRPVLYHLKGRGGLCAQILTSGTIRRGDAIRTAENGADVE